MALRHIAGILLIVGFVLAMVTAIPMLFVGSAVSDIDPQYEWLGELIIVVGVLELVFGLGALLGGAMAITGNSWTMALVGSAFCIASVGPYYVSILLGAIAIAILFIAKREFELIAPAFEGDYDDYGEMEPPYY